MLPIEQPGRIDQANRAVLPETLVGLVERYSPSGQEQAAVEWLVGRMKSLGYDDAFVDGAGNAVGVTGSGPRQIVLLGHIDTVPGEIQIRVEGDVLYGRGTVDAKGPLACFVDAASQTRVPEGWQIVVIGAVDEERNSTGARYLVGRYCPDYAVIGEPNRWDRVALGYKGSAWAQVILHKEQAHTAGGNETASEAAVRLWLAVQDCADEYNRGKSRAFDRILPVLSGINSGQDGYSQWARMEIGARLPLELLPEGWYALLDTAAAQTGAEIIPAGTPLPAWTCEKNTPLVRAFLSAVRSQGGEPAFVYKTGTADLNVVAPVWQCPALVYGPGDSALDHTPNEHLSIDEYRESVDVLTQALLILMK